MISNLSKIQFILLKFNKFFKLLQLVIVVENLAKRFSNFGCDVEVTAATPEASLLDASAASYTSEITAIAETSEIAPGGTLFSSKMDALTQTSSIGEFASSPAKGSGTGELRSSHIFTISAQQMAFESVGTASQGIQGACSDLL